MEQTRTLIKPASTSDVTLTLPTSTDTLAVAGDIMLLQLLLDSLYK